MCYTSLDIKAAKNVNEYTKVAVGVKKFDSPIANID